MKTFFTVRFNDPDKDVELQATFKKELRAIEYLASNGGDGYIE